MIHTEEEIAKLSVWTLGRIVLHLLCCLFRWHHWVYRSPARERRRCAYCKRRQMIYSAWGGVTEGTMKVWVDVSIEDRQYRSEHC